VLTHHDDIAATLAEHGVRLARWSRRAPAPGQQPDEVLDACRAPWTG
jgi:1,2-dihydroxy-3-keto-5-methylthiopentene dioxygenase